KSMSGRIYGAVVAAVVASAAACAPTALRARDVPSLSNTRQSVISRAQLWNPTDVRAMDVKTGPQGEGSFPFRATVYCDYLDKKLGGDSPKFACTIGKDDEVKVKFGGANGEVYGEVLTTRLLWALGFGADRMYPVNVICRRCPSAFGGIERPNHESRFDPAVIERKADGKEWQSEEEAGWGGGDLDAV